MSIEAAVLLKHWGVSGVSRQENSGGSRRTWHLADTSWLTSSPMESEDAFRRETQLLCRLDEEIQSADLDIQVPRLINSLQQESLVTEAGALWRRTENIQGIKLSASESRTYPALIKGLNLFHKVLAKVPVQDAPLAQGVVSSLWERGAFQGDQELPRQVFAWLKVKLPLLRHHPEQLTHGDFNPTNVIYFDYQTGLRVAGVLDFEMGRPDPAVMDYSQLFTMLVCHSGFSDVHQATDDIVRGLQGRFTHEELRIAMVAYWLDLYFRWSVVNAAAEEKIRLRLNQVWKFVSAY